jgi:hypothetical protein
MDEAVSNNLHCLCYKYKDHVGVDWADPEAGGEWYLHQYIPSVGPITGSIEGKGSLVEAINGKCEDRTFYVSTNDETGGTEPDHHTPWYIGYMPLASEVDVPMPPRLHNAENGAVWGHRIVPVVNEECLYTLWMCACWANQADGCLCAYENPGKVDIKVVRPYMGVCPAGSSKLENTGTIVRDEGTYASAGMGALALKCSPNPCQACCKDQGCKCCGGNGCGGGCRGGGGCGKGCRGKGKKGGCGCGGGGGTSISQNVNNCVSGGCDDDCGCGGGSCDCGGGGGGCYGSCSDCCGKGDPCSCQDFIGCDNPFL